MNLIITLYFSFLLTALLVLVFMKIGERLGIVDEPNSRKVHLRPVPRTGGAGIIIGTLVPLVFLLEKDQVLLGLCLGAMCMLFMGILDDKWDLNYKWKFLGQILAAVVTLLVSGIRFHTFGEIWPGYILDLGMLSLPFSTLFLVATTNMINMSDGLDGLAGGICLLIFSCVGFLAFFQGDFLTLTVTVCCVGAVAGFLRYNTYPAIVFMGDTGSQFLGFFAGLTTLMLTQDKSIYSPIIALYVLGIPAIDITIVVFQRILDRRPVFGASKDHLHHKLLKLGFQHKEAVIFIYAMQLVMIVTAWSVRFADDAILLTVYLCVLGMMLTLAGLSLKIPFTIPSIYNQTGQVKRNPLRYKLQSFSRRTISKVTFYGMVISMSLFYCIPPLVCKSFPMVVGIVSVSMIILFFILNKKQNSFISYLLMICLYSIGIYYIFLTEYKVNLLNTQEVSNICNLLLLFMGVFYLGYIITAFEKIPFSALNYLLLAVVIFLFFLPNSYLESNHLNSIAAKVFLIFLVIDLIFYKFESFPSLVLGSAFITLALNSIVAFSL